MTQGEFDLLVVGAGPGGSCAAAYARMRGLRTLVVEKTEFPRFRIGESLLPMGNAVLHEIGVWPKIVGAGFMPKYGAEFHTADGSLAKHVVFGQSLVPGLESTFQVERARFDALLLDHARSLGAHVKMKTTVRAVESVEHGHRVQLVDAAGDEATLFVPWVIDATGRESALVTEQKRELEPPVFPKRMAIFSHFGHVRRAPGRDGGNIIVVRVDDGWFWVIPLDEQRTSVGLVTTVARFRAAQSTQGESSAPGARRAGVDYFERVVAESPKLRQLLAGARPLMDFHVVSDYSYFRRELAAERMVLIGDAAGFLDPVFSSGVHLATSSAKRAVELIARAHARGRGLTRRQQQTYTREIKRYTKVFERLIQAFYDDKGFEVFMCQTIPWGLSRGLTSIVAGHAKLIWPLWWRYQVFLLVCRLQRRWKVVKPPEDSAARAAA